jgi:hypothetical protein
MPLTNRPPSWEKMAIFAERLYLPDATAAAGPPVRLGSWLTSALARAGRELSRAILGSPRDQRTAEEGLPQWPLANEACLTRYTGWIGDDSPCSVCRFLTLPEPLSVAPMHHWAQ